MRILIVDDNRALTETTAELLWCIDEGAHYFEAITVAGNLQSAVRLLPEHDLVLCDGEFPDSPESPDASEQWPAVFREACRHGVEFILYSGSAVCLEDARQSQIAAIAKPATIEDIYGALIARRASHSPFESIYVVGHAHAIQRGGQV
jgi:CheY-like chemotaxis protein